MSRWKILTQDKFSMANHFSFVKTLLGFGFSLASFASSSAPALAAQPVISTTTTKVAEGTSEGGKMVFVVSMQKQAGASPVKVRFHTTSGTAKENDDFRPLNGSVVLSPGKSASISVALKADKLNEENETFYLDLEADGATLKPARVAATILNDDPLPALSIAPVRFIEGSNPKTMDFAVKLSGASGRTVSVNVKPENASVFPARSGKDYQAIPVTRLTFAPGERIKTLSVPILDDTVDEEDEQLVVGLSQAFNATIAVSKASGTIIDNDAPPSVRIADVMVRERTGRTPGVAQFTAVLLAASERKISLTYATANKSAVAGRDYATAAPTKLEFAPGQTRQKFTVPLIDDAIYEVNEEFLLKVSSGINVKIETPTVTATIMDDDAYPVISVAKAEVPEGNSGTSKLNFVLSLSPLSSLPVNVLAETGAQSSRAAFPGIDYIPRPSTRFVFKPGESSKTFTVEVKGDKVDEPDEDVTLSLTSLSGATLKTPVVNGVIKDDDTSTASLVNASIAEGNENSPTLTFPLELSTPYSRDIKVDYELTPLTAQYPEDYLAQSGSLTLSAGATGLDIPVKLVADTQKEGDETFAIRLTFDVPELGPLEAVGTILDDDIVTLSQSGKLAYESNNADIFVMNTDGSNRTQLTSDADRDLDPAFSRDGSKIVYASKTGSSESTPYSITIMNADGSGKKRLTQRPVNDMSPAFSPDGSQIVFVSDEQIWIMNSDGSNQRSLTPERDYSRMQPEFSPDGKKIVFTARKAPVVDHEFDIYVMNVDGSGVTKLTSNATDQYEPTYTPDGKKIVFSLGSLLHQINTDGTGQAPLSEESIGGSEPSFSADGQWIFTSKNQLVIEARAANGDLQLTYVTANGSMSHPSWAPGRVPVQFSIGDVAVNEGNGASTTASFPVTLSSPSEKTITVQYSTIDGSAKAGSDYISSQGTLTFAPGVTQQQIDVTILADGQGEDTEQFEVQLSQPSGAEIWITGATPNSTPGVGRGTITNVDFTPLSQSGKIAFASVVNGNSDIYVMNADGTNRTRLTTNEGFDGLPNFSSDGTRIVFTSSRSNPDYAEIYVMNADGSGQTHVAAFIPGSKWFPTFSPDGRRIAFWNQGGDYSGLYVMNADGTNAVKLAAGMDNTAPAFSPDGSKIIFWSRASGTSELYSANTDRSGTPGLIATVTNGSGPSFSHNGQRIVFSADGTLYRVGADGSDLRLFGGQVVYGQSPVYAPVDDWVAYSFNGAIYVMHSDGTAPTRLTPNRDEVNSEPSWAPGRVPHSLSVADASASEGEGEGASTVLKFIVTLSSPSTQAVQVDYRTVDGSAKAGLDYTSAQGTLTIPAGAQQAQIEVVVLADTLVEESELLQLQLSSPKNAVLLEAADGLATGLIVSSNVPPLGASGKIAFVSNTGSAHQVFIMNADGTDKQQLTDQGQINTRPSFSRDGSKIVFTSNRDGFAEIYVMNPDGTEQTRLTSNSSEDTSPSFSPDGSKIVYISNTSGYQNYLTIMDADGSHPLILDPFSTLPIDSLSTPRFSPDGSQIVFMGSPDNLGAYSEIYIINADGTGVRRVTNDHFIDGAPMFSPDGQKILFMSYRDTKTDGTTTEGASEIYTVDLDGKNLTRLTNDTMPDVSPVYGPSGWIAFTKNYGEQKEIYVMKADGSGAVQVTNNTVFDDFPTWGLLPAAEVPAAAKQSAPQPTTTPSAPAA
jgi:Tol biopolymer transport system component